MSASRDRDQRFTFLYSNLYKLYRAGKKAATEAEVPLEEPMTKPLNATPPPPAPTLAVIRARREESAKESAEWKSPVRIENFSPVEFMGLRVELPGTLTRAPALDPTHAKPALDRLSRNLESLSEVEARMQYMLDEIQALLKKK